MSPSPRFAGAWPSAEALRAGTSERGNAPLRSATKRSIEGSRFVRSAIAEARDLVPGNPAVGRGGFELFLDEVADREQLVHRAIGDRPVTVLDRQLAALDGRLDNLEIRLGERHAGSMA